MRCVDVSDLCALCGKIRRELTAEMKERILRKMLLANYLPDEELSQR